MKQTFIVKDPDSKIRFLGTAISVRNSSGECIVGFNQMIHLYLHQDIDISVKTAIRIARMVPLNFVDKRSKVMAEITTGATVSQ